MNSFQDVKINDMQGQHMSHMNKTCASELEVLSMQLKLYMVNRRQSEPFSYDI